MAYINSYHPVFSFVLLFAVFAVNSVRFCIKDTFNNRLLIQLQTHEEMLINIHIHIEPFQAQLSQMVTLQSVQDHTGLIHLYNFLTLWCPGQHRTAQMPKKLKRVGQTSMALNSLVDSFLSQSEKVWD